jgi:hypothetical protein
MLKKISVIAVMMAAGILVSQACADEAQGPNTSVRPATPRYAPRPTARRSYSAPPTLPWPAYANYGNPVGSSYSKAAGLRSGQIFGTFGNRPADARARGAY